MEADVRTRRGPKAAPIHTAGTVTNIGAAVCAVVIHAPSSNPAPTAPRISARPNEERRVLSVEMKVPRNTARGPNHGIEVGGDASVRATMPGEGAGAAGDAWKGIFIPVGDPSGRREQ